MLSYDGIARHPGAYFEEDIVLSERVAAVDTTAPDSATVTTAQTAFGSAEMLALVLASLDDDKAEEVVSIPLKGKSAMADHMVVASGRSSRQVSAMAEKLIDRIKAASGKSARVEGRETGDWVLIDAGDVIVHLFRPEVREFYQLEKMWLGPMGDPEQTPTPTAI